MHRYILFPLTAILLFLPFVIIPSSAENKNFSAVPTPTPLLESSIKIESFELDRSAIAIPCPYYKACEDHGLINVMTSSVSKSAVTYHYTVSAGKIEGNGAKVVWNLDDVREGDYSITVEISDASQAKHQKATRIVKVRDCECHPLPQPCDCPIISITTPASFVKAGKVVIFTADVKENSKRKLTNNWTISGGEIIEGQGTRRIKVKTMPEMTDSNLTTTVYIGGTDPVCACESQASKTISIRSKSK